MVSIHELRMRYRIANMAIFDWVSSIVAILIIGKVFNVDYKSLFILLIPITIIIHILFGVRSTLVNLFYSSHLMQLFIIGLLVLFFYINK